MGQGSGGQIQVRYKGLYWHGQRQEALEGEYPENYHPVGERVARLRLLTGGRVVRVRTLDSSKEVKTSPTYDEMLTRSTGRYGLNVRLVLSPGGHLAFCLCEPLPETRESPCNWIWSNARFPMCNRLPGCTGHLSAHMPSVHRSPDCSTTPASDDDRRSGAVEGRPPVARPRCSMCPGCVVASCCHSERQPQSNSATTPSFVPLPPILAPSSNPRL